MGGGSKPPVNAMISDEIGRKAVAASRSNGFFDGCRRDVRAGAGWALAVFLVVAPAMAAPDADQDDIRSSVVPLPSLDLVPTDGVGLDAERFGTLTGSGQYRHCIDKIAVTPDDAFDLAQTWRDQGGGAPASHCAALALIELGHTAEGARRLETLAQEPGAIDVPLRIGILSQAGNAWLLADNPGRAVDAFTTAINLGVEDPEVSLASVTYDRARAHALLADWRTAERDLSTVIEQRPRDLSALILRARARRFLNRPGEARADIETALALAPQDPAALIENGLQAQARGDREAARQAWLEAAVGGEGTPLGQAAQALLEALDLNADAPIEEAPAGSPPVEPVEHGPTGGEQMPAPDPAPRSAIDILMEQGFLTEGAVSTPPPPPPNRQILPMEQPASGEAAPKRRVPRTAIEALELQNEPD